MHDIVTDKSYDLEKSYEYILSIQVSLDGFSFSVVDPEENKLLIFKNSSLKISSEALIARRFKEWTESIDIFKNPFKKIRIIVFNNKFTLIPSKYSSKELKKGIPHLLFSENTEPDIAENIIRKFESRLIFALPQDLNNVIREQIGECEIIHPVKIIANQLPEIKKEHGLVLLFDTQRLYIILFSATKILLANSFKVTHANDIVYYLLTTLKQIGIKPDSSEVFYAGKITDKKETLLKLKEHFSSIDKLPAKKPLQQFNSKLKILAVHKNLSLYI